MIEAKALKSNANQTDPDDPLALKPHEEATTKLYSGWFVSLLSVGLYIRSFLWTDPPTELPPAEASSQDDPGTSMGKKAPFQVLDNLSSGGTGAGQSPLDNVTLNAAFRLPVLEGPFQNQFSVPPFASVYGNDAQYASANTSLPLFGRDSDPVPFRFDPERLPPALSPGFDVQPDAIIRPVPIDTPEQNKLPSPAPGLPESPAEVPQGGLKGRPVAAIPEAREETGAWTPDASPPPAGSGAPDENDGGTETPTDGVATPVKTSDGPVRNRAPRNNGPVYLGDVGSGATLAIALAHVLAQTTDADGDGLSATLDGTSSGDLEIRGDGWRYLADTDFLGEVELEVTVTDGTEVVEQTVVLNVVENVLTGTDGDDLLVGAHGRDAISGLGGDDNLAGLEGRDRMYGGDGDDNLAGGAGDDMLYGGAGDDIIAAGAGDDLVFGGDGDDRIFGEDGADEIYGDSGDDMIDGGAGHDVLHGGIGADEIHGDSGDDVIDGGAGHDVLSGGTGADEIYGDSGDDIIDGGAGHDVLHGGIGADEIHGDSGDDVIDGGAGHDVLSGGTGADEIYGDSGDDIIDGGAGHDVVHGGIGADEIHGDSGDDVIDGGAGHDVLSGGTGADEIYGDSGDDMIAGGDGNDALSGGTGNDMLSGAAGDDVIHGDAGKDTLDGGAGDDVLSGGAGNDWLEGAAGEDVLFGDEGDDHLFGGKEADLLFGGDGRDHLDGGNGDDILSGDAGADHLTGGAGADVLIGGAGADTVAGGDGDDLVIADDDAAADAYDGGAGHDQLDYSDAAAGIDVDMIDGTIAGLTTGQDQFDNFEQIIGTAHDDTFTAGAGEAEFTGNGGADSYRFVQGDTVEATHAAYKINDFDVDDAIWVGTGDFQRQIRKSQQSLEDRIEGGFDNYAIALDVGEPRLRFQHDWTDEYRRTIVEVDFENDLVFDLEILLEGEHLLVLDHA